jgi:hypothetical protein
MTTSTGGAALIYARRGWAVLACHDPASAGGCTCGRPACASPAKHPRTRRGLHEATTDQAAIAAWWRRWPNANVAVRTGAASRLVVVDIDPGHGGEESLAGLVAAHGPLPDTVAVHTGGGGRHLYFAHPGGTVRNSAGALGPGLDVRGDGGYVLAPPSRHVTGDTYRWVTTGRSAPLPAWLLYILGRPTANPAPPRQAPLRDPAAPTTAWAREALAGELARIRHSEPGRRNNDLNRAAFALGQLVGAGHLDAGPVHDLLVDAGLATGLVAHEVAATVRSGLGAGSCHPRHPPHRPRTFDLRTVDLPVAEPPARIPVPDVAAPPLP